MIPNQREYKIASYLVWAKPEFIYICYVTIASPIQFPLSSLNANSTHQKVPREVVPYRPTQTVMRRNNIAWKLARAAIVYITARHFC